MSRTMSRNTGCDDIGAYFVDPQLDHLREAEVTVDRILFYRDHYTASVGVALHSLLVVEVKSITLKGQRVHPPWIMAQKLYDGSRPGKIKVEIVRHLPETLMLQQEVHMEGCGKISMRALIDLLRDRSHTLRKVVQAFADLPGTTAMKKREFAFIHWRMYGKECWANQKSGFTQESVLSVDDVGHKHGSTYVVEPLELELFREGMALVRKVFHCRDAKAPDVVYNDFIILEVKSVELQGETFHGTLWIKAEKSACVEGGRVMKVQMLEFLEEDEFVMRHEVDMDGTGVIQMSILLDMIGDQGPLYNANRNLWWNYGHDTLKKLVQRFVELPDTTTDKKRELQDILAELCVESDEKGIRFFPPRYPKDLPLLVLSQPWAGQNGSHFTDPALNDLMEGEVTVAGIAYYKEPMSRSQIWHNFIVVEVKAFALQGRRVNTFWLMAQKTYEEKRGAIKVEIVGSLATALLKKHELKMQSCGTIRLSALVEILLDDSPHYDIMRNNCWKYADETFMKLLRCFAELPGTSLQMKEEIEAFLLGLSPLELPSNVLDNFARAFVWSCGVAFLVVVALAYHSVAFEGHNVLDTAMVGILCVGFMCYVVYACCAWRRMYRNGSTKA